MQNVPIRATGEAMPGISRRALLASATAAALLPPAVSAASTPAWSTLPELVARLRAAIAANLEADAAYDAALSAFDRAYLADPIRYSTSAGDVTLELQPRAAEGWRHMRIEGNDVRVPSAVCEAHRLRCRAAADSCCWTEDEVRLQPELIAERRATAAAAMATSLDLLKADAASVEAASEEYDVRHRAAVGETLDESDARIFAEWDIRAAFYAFPCTTDSERRLKIDTLMTIDAADLEELSVSHASGCESHLAVFIKSLCTAGKA